LDREDAHGSLPCSTCACGGRSATGIGPADRRAEVGRPGRDGPGTGAAAGSAATRCRSWPAASLATDDESGARPLQCLGRRISEAAATSFALSRASAKAGLSGRPGASLLVARSTTRPGSVGAGRAEGAGSPAGRRTRSICRGGRLARLTARAGASSAMRASVVEREPPPVERCC
jgi:hypothetical protein